MTIRDMLDADIKIMGNVLFKSFDTENDEYLVHGTTNYWDEEVIEGFIDNGVLDAKIKGFYEEDGYIIFLIEDPGKIDLRAME